MYGRRNSKRRCQERGARARGFVDGSGWQGVYDVLKKDGYKVSIVQNPTISLTDDVAVTKRTLAAQDGPAILVGHSYGGAVITEAGNDPKVAGLVYIAAFAPDTGESVFSLIKNPAPGAPVPPILPPQDGFLLLDRAKFQASFAADVSADAAAFMADSQVPWGLDALNGAVTAPAWKTKPSWYLVATDDRMIPPDAQRAMSKRAGSTVVEAKGSHSVYVSQPRAVADLIAKAARSIVFYCYLHLFFFSVAGGLVVNTINNAANFNDQMPVIDRVDAALLLIDRELLEGSRSGDTA